MTASVQPPLPSTSQFDDTPSRVVTGGHITDSAFVDVRQTIEDSPAAQGLTWDQINNLALSVHHLVEASSRELNDSVDELTGSWKEALEHGKKPPRYLLDACPKWLRENLGYGAAA